MTTDRDRCRCDVGAARPSVSRLSRRLLQAPIHVYRWSLKPLIGWECRHLPTCSEYALDAIELNGAWRGFWLTLSRVLRCNPWGSAGYDPPQDIRAERYVLAPWRYGRWSGRHIAQSWTSAIEPRQ